MNRDLNKMREQGQANVWGEHSKERGTTSTKSVRTGACLVCSKNSKKAAYVKLSEQEGVTMEMSS